MNSHKYNIVIIGAGPTGLGAAHRLQELGEDSFHIFERRGYIGGLATSFKDRQGFLWDIGGHVQFSHYDYFDKLMDLLLPNEWFTHQRESWVWMYDRFIPYPFQYNIHRLPEAIRDDCLNGLIELAKNPVKGTAKNFRDWVLQTFGQGIARYFLEPYNFKVWAHPLEMMSTSWVGERVAVVNLERVKKNIQENNDDLAWGPNNVFRFPKKGGTGAIWSRLGERIGSKNISLEHEVVSIRTDEKRVLFKNGLEVEYNYLINTSPLDTFVERTDLPSSLKKTAAGLKHSTTYIVGAGLTGKPKANLATKCWMYFPESNCPFYRVTLFSNYSPFNVPDPSKHWSLMTEVSASEYKKVGKDTVVEEVIRGLKNTDLIQPTNSIVSTWLHSERYGYPTPTVDRDTILNQVQPELMKKDILSRGRFGMWKYEVSNQDHSLMQGVEAANFIVNKEPETTAWHPEIVNSKR